MTIPAVHKITGFPACVHLSICFNEHAVVYQTVSEWVEGAEALGWLEWTSPAEQETAMVTDRVWTCRWYPDTPVGFFVLAASTLEALMAAVNIAREGE